MLRESAIRQAAIMLIAVTGGDLCEAVCRECGGKGLVDSARYSPGLDPGIVYRECMHCEGTGLVEPRAVGVEERRMLRDALDRPLRLAMQSRRDAAWRRRMEEADHA